MEESSWGLNPIQKKNTMKQLKKTEKNEKWKPRDAMLYCLANDSGIYFASSYFLN